MIPKKLRFAAFGPFNKEQVIDFSKFKDDRLFLISGKTGSGKTTIFDAISFSLFGKPSGSLRETDSFKSHFSDEKDVCFAEFEFFSKGKNYVIYREPIQMKLKRTGNLVRENAVARLTIDQKETISGSDAVNRKIEEILGLNADQFKKIVMLPQGEFRKFLSDDSGEKQKILRRIFSTEIIESFTDKLRENASEAKRLFEDSETMCKAYISNIYAPENSVLKAEIENENPDFNKILSELECYSSLLSSEIEGLKKEENRLNDEKSKINLPYFKEINSKFSELSSCKEKLSKLKEEEERITALKSDIQKIKAAKEIMPFEEKYKSSLLLKEESKNKIEKIKSEAEKNRNLISRCSVYYDEWKAKFDRLDVCNEELQNLKIKLRSAKDLKSEQDRLNEIAKEKDSAFKAISESKQKIEYQKLIEDGTALKEKLVLLAEAEEAAKKAEDLNALYIKLSDEYQQALAGFIGSQSYNLALNLKEDAPCPVCGSINHPSPAKKPRVLVTDNELDTKKQEYDLAYRECLNQKALLDGLLSQAEIESCDMIQSKKEELSQKLKEARLLMKEGEFQKLFGQKFDIEAELEVIKETERRLAALSERYTLTDEKIRTLSASEEVTDVSEIEREINESESFIAEIKKNYEAANSYKQGYLNRENELRGMLSQEEASLAEKTEKSLLAKHEFDCAVNESILNYEEYLLFAERENELQELENEVQAYNTESAALNSMIESYTRQLQGLSPVNIFALQEEYDVLNEKIKEKEAVIKDNELILNANDAVKNKLKNELKRSEEIYKKYTRCNHIYDLAQGKFSGNVNLERYILASYFEDIIDSANLRLEEMSNSRYTLKRRYEKEKGRRSSGLELEVMDAYSGTNRHVNTLSGGESFMVSLSLALGLADIMSEASGGIEVDTMFIDEGFGSLDSDSLTAAIQCLEKIKKTGRYIGIISHVSELKENIPSRINVLQSNVGSYISQE